MSGVPMVDFIQIVCFTESFNIVALLAWVAWPVWRDARREARAQRRVIETVLKRSGLDPDPRKN